jgi:hypothetical protein
MIEPVKHIPFHSIEEINFHVDMSQILEQRIKERINQLPETAPETRDDLLNYISDSLNVLIDGYVNMLLSLEQGYVK